MCDLIKHLQLVPNEGDDIIAIIVIFSDHTQLKISTEVEEEEQSVSTIVMCAVILLSRCM